MQILKSSIDPNLPELWTSTQNRTSWITKTSSATGAGNRLHEEPTDTDQCSESDDITTTGAPHQMTLFVLQLIFAGMNVHMLCLNPPAIIDYLLQRKST